MKVKDMADTIIKLELTEEEQAELACIAVSFILTCKVYNFEIKEALELIKNNRKN